MDERLLDVNEHGILRVPGVMWLALLLLARHWFWVVFTIASAGQSGASMVLLSGGLPWWPMAAQIPVVLLLLSGWRRAPDSAPFWRGVWTRGHVLVSLTAALNLCWTGWSLSQSSDWHLRPELVLVCFSLLDVVTAWGMWTSKYLRQVLAEFPLSKQVPG